MPVFPPFLDTSGKLHHNVVAKATLTKVDASSTSDDGAAGSRSGIAAAAAAEVKALSNEIQTLHKLDREPQTASSSFPSLPPLRSLSCD